MLKNSRFFKKRASYKPFSATKKHWVILLYTSILIIFLIGSNFAGLSFDSSKNYDAVTKTATITNNLGGAKLAEVQLIANTYYCREDCYAIGNITTYETSTLLDSIRFEKYKSGRWISESITSYNILLANKVTPKEIKEYGTICVSKNTSCSVQETGSHYEYDYEWEAYDNSELPAGTYYFKIAGKKKPTEKVDWLASFFGVEIADWAFWDGLIRYEYYSSGGDAEQQAYDVNMKAQTFRVGNVGQNITHNISAVGLQMYVVNPPTENISVQIRPLSAGLPATNSISNGTYDGSGLTAVPLGEWFNVSMQSVQLTQGEAYALVISCWECDDDYGYRWVYDNGDSTYSGGGQTNSANNGTTWGDPPTDTSDYMFELYGEEEKVNVQLLVPEDASTISSPYTFFNSTITPLDDGLTNATLRIWKDGAVANEVYTFTGSPTQITSASFNLSLPSGNYTWNVYGCEGDATPDNCSWALANYTFTWRPFSINEEAYNNDTLEGSVENFQINISVVKGYQPENSYFVYNYTEYSATTTNLGGNNYTLSRSVTAPNVDAVTNITFYWKLGFDDASVYNSTLHNQSVTNFGIGNCTTYEFVLLNYSLRDEESQGFLDGLQYNTTIEVYTQIFPLTSSTAILSYNATYNVTNPAEVCISRDLLNATFRLDAVARYKADDREPEYHYIQNYSLKNSTLTQNINLFDILTADSTDFLITYKDNQFLPVKDALIDITRLYVGDGAYKSVEIVKTDNAGQGVAHLVESDVVYTIVVSKNGRILSTFDNVVAICADRLTGDCKINLNDFATSINPLDILHFKNVDIIYFNLDGQDVNLIYSTADGTSVTLGLNVTKFDRFENETICSDTLSSSSGTLSCSIPVSYGNVTIIADVYSDGDFLLRRTFSIRDDPTEIFGKDSYVFLIILIITLPLMFITSSIGVIIGAILGFVMGGLLIISTGGSVFGYGSAIGWLLVASLILIWKISERRSG